MKFRNPLSGLLLSGVLAVGCAIAACPSPLNAQAIEKPKVVRPEVTRPQIKRPSTVAPGVGVSEPGKDEPNLSAPEVPGLVGEQTPLSLTFPVACRLGQTCWLVNFVDHDIKRGFRDFNCGPHGYNGHKGTDIAIRDYRAMEDGVSVLAAAPGRVVGIRDGVIDGDIALAGVEATGGRDCGNGVTIQHDGGWRTSYCHLKRNSLVVNVDQDVERGQKLGEVGSSGRSQFPHLHLEVRHKTGRVIDPFVGLERDAQCGPGLRPLWDARLLGIDGGGPSTIYDAGFARREPNPVALRQGFYRDRSFSQKAPNLIFWMDSFWIKEGDTLELRIIGPDGEIIAANSDKIRKTQARYMSYIGKPRGVDWRPGTYVGEAKIIRERANRPREVIEISRKLRIR